MYSLLRSTEFSLCLKRSREEIETMFSGNWFQTFGAREKKLFFQIIFIIQLILFLDNFVPCEFVFKEEIEMNFENNEEAGPSGIVVKEEMETDEEAGTKIIASDA